MRNTSSVIMRRLFDFAVVLVGASIIVFLMIRLIPGDAVEIMLSSNGEATEQQVSELRAKLGLNRSMPDQYVRWLGDVVRGDFGNSLWTGKPVLGEIGDRIGITLELTFLSLAVAVALAIPLGAAMAYMRGSRLDLAMRVVTVSGVTMPSFWLGALLIYLAALWLPAWPTIGTIPSWSEDPLKHLQRMLLPTIATALPALSSLARIIRSAMLDALSQDYVRTARAKGLGEGSVVFKHALLNSLIPFVTALGITTGYLFGGAIVVEQVFAIPGLGRLIVGAIADRNYPLIQAAILVVTVGFVAINAVIDILYVVIDRRVAL